MGEEEERRFRPPASVAQKATINSPQA